VGILDEYFLCISKISSNEPAIALSENVHQDMGLSGILQRRIIHTELPYVKQSPHQAHVPLEEQEREISVSERMRSVSTQQEDGIPLLVTMLWGQTQQENITQHSATMDSEPIRREVSIFDSDTELFQAIQPEDTIPQLVLKVCNQA
jgi:hypothetical protein